MVKDFFAHLEENLQIKVQILDQFGHPIIIDDHDIEFATSFELFTPTIQLFDLNDGITIVSEEFAIVEINLFPTILEGYDDKNLVYQLRTINKNTNIHDVVLEGRIFITPSLFD